MIFEQPETATQKKNEESMCSDTCNVSQNSADKVVFDKWLEDIDHYERTLSDMATASMDQNFKEELGAIEQWFRVLSEAERTSALYSLLNQATQVQIRFLIMVLQQQAQADPLSDILSPANFNKDAMTEKMSQPIPVPSSTPQQPISPPFQRPSTSKVLDSSAIQQMFPDAAAALANQRAELNRKKNGQLLAITPTGQTMQTSLTLPSKDDGARTPWTPSFRKNFESPARPKSAEPSKTGTLKAHIAGTPLRSPRTDLNASSAPYSPFGDNHGGGNWASMTNTPATAMFPQASINIESLQQRLAASEVPRSVSSSVMQSSPRIVLESDVKKFRKPSRSPNVGEYATGLPSSPLMMYDDNGQLMSAHATQQLNSPILARMRSPMGVSPQQTGHLWQMMTPGSNGFAYSTSSPVLSMEGGYLSDNSSGRRRAPQTKPVENPADLKLLSDIPAWLRQLRLHKYTDNLKSMKWQDMVKLNEGDLEAKGISAQGARRKLLKAFEIVDQAVLDGVITA